MCALQHRRPGTAAPKKSPAEESSAPRPRTSRVRANFKPHTGSPAPASTEPAPTLAPPDIAPNPATRPAPRSSRVRINLGDRGRDRNAP
ncbi:hypothetical protein [Streptomyces colonosanans]|uniref:Uncharacterized protein n=1 Tax=Streptomyces colonosanans TaxID=1428652 RepID=A0A1S2Q4J5_9ACTN|nr:hypothetical protein [Streptomyces colonosanans]OIK00693.1 hypothetical protein BIV24_02885 [Streptomyces colonosanans]